MNRSLSNTLGALALADRPRAGCRRFVYRGRRHPRLANLSRGSGGQAGRGRDRSTLCRRGGHADAGLGGNAVDAGVARNLRGRGHGDLALWSWWRGADHPLPGRPERGGGGERPGHGAGACRATLFARQRAIPSNGPAVPAAPAGGGVRGWGRDGLGTGEQGAQVGGARAGRTFMVSTYAQGETNDRSKQSADWQYAGESSGRC